MTEKKAILRSLRNQNWEKVKVENEKKKNYLKLSQ